MKLPVFSAAWAARAPPVALRPLAFLSAASRPFAAHPTPAPFLLARCLATRSRDASGGSAPKAPKEASRAKKKKGFVLVTVGDVGDDAGPFNLLKNPGVEDMDRLSLLKALAGTKGFAPDLAGMALDMCTVHVCTSASVERPSADEAKAAVPLEGATTLGALTATAPPGASLFVRVTLPGSAAAAGNTLPPSHPIATLARAILAAPAPSPQHPHIVLDGAVWPIIDSRVLFVRHFYGDFYAGVLGHARDGYTHRHVRFDSVCVTGNPGIGKSSFGYYALFRALRDGRTVVYHAEKPLSAETADEIFLFKGPSVSVDPHAIDDALNDPHALYISDSVAPAVVAAFTLYVTSPRRERTWEYRKTDHASMRCFPVLTWDEIDAMRVACFPHVPEADAKERYTRWGGIPRYVLAHTGVERRVLEGALDDVPALDLSVAFDDPTIVRNGDGKSYHRVFHSKVHGEVDDTLRTHDPAYYKFLGRDFASSYVAKQVAQRATALQRAEMVRLFDESEGEREMAVARGHVFEVLALERLSRGGRFPVRKLGAPASQGGEFLELPPARRRTFHSLDAALPADDEQLEPASESFCAIDAVLVGRRLANATCSKPHGIVLRGVRHKIGLEEAAARLGLQGVIEFYWIVPPAEFPAWDAPLPLCDGTSALTPDEVARDEVGRRVVQYVVQVDISPPEAPWSKRVRRPVRWYAPPPLPPPQQQLS